MPALEPEILIPSLVGKPPLARPKMKPAGSWIRGAVLGLILLLLPSAAGWASGGTEKNLLSIESPAAEKQTVLFKSVNFLEKSYFSKKGPLKSITVVLVFEPGSEPAFAAWVGRQTAKKRAVKVEALVETLLDNQLQSLIRLKGLRVSQVRAHQPEFNQTEVTFTAGDLIRELLKSKPPEDPD